MILLGVNLRNSKNVLYALRYFEGVGLHTAQHLCDMASIHRQCRVEELTDVHIGKLKPLLQTHLEQQRQQKLALAKKRSLVIPKYRV